MADSNPFDGINSCKYLYLRSISEPSDNCLLVQIEEGGCRPANH